MKRHITTVFIILSGTVGCMHAAAGLRFFQQAGRPFYRSAQQGTRPCAPAMQQRQFGSKDDFNEWLKKYSLDKDIKAASDKAKKVYDASRYKMGRLNFPRTYLETRRLRTVLDQLREAQREARSLYSDRPNAAAVAAEVAVNASWGPEQLMEIETDQRTWETLPYVQKTRITQGRRPLDYYHTQEALDLAKEIEDTLANARRTQDDDLDPSLPGISLPERRSIEKAYLDYLNKKKTQ